MNPSVSFIIRAYNEASELEQLLQCLKTQNYPHEKIEVIVVNNGSTDSTELVATKYGCKIAFLPQEKFSYPKSLNIGIEQAKNDLLVLLSAHCLPISSNWLSAGTEHFSDPSVAGTYGPIKPTPGAPVSERIFYGATYLLSSINGTCRVKRPKTGILGATNCIIRRDLWQKHHFNEEHGAGGEDYEWADWALTNNYTIISEPQFAVYHSHHLGFFKLLKQLALWKHLTGKPRPFNPEDLSFRNKK